MLVLIIRVKMVRHVNRVDLAQAFYVFAPLGILELLVRHVNKLKEPSLKPVRKLILIILKIMLVLIIHV